MKKILRLLFPDPGAGSPPTTEGQPLANKQGWIAEADLELLEEGKRVSTWWSTAPNGTTYPLIYITPAQFAIRITNYDTALTARMALGTGRPMQTKTLMDLDKDVDTAVKQMRLDIGNKFGAANRFAMFPQFGFIRRRERWEFPRDHENRKNSIRLCKEACIANGMTTITYNDAWWTQMETDYKAAVLTTQTTASAISGQVAVKNPERDEVDEVLHSLYHVIRGNHPNDYHQILRVAGYLKEDI